MLNCEDITVKAPGSATRILHGITMHWAPGQLHAVIGPSGCGKTTLMKALLGLTPSQGRVTLDGVGMSGAGALTGRVGFAPQFSIAQPNLTVAEAVASASRLYVGKTQAQQVHELLETVGLSAQAQTRVGALSGGQLRRLGLALELTLDPPYLICDEVTSGLDPRSEDQILGVLRQLCHSRGMALICIIHNLAKLPKFDTVSVLHGGHAVFQGSPQALLETFKIPDALHLYDRLAEQPSESWAQASGAEAFALAAEARQTEDARQAAAHRAAVTPGSPAQFLELLRRRGLLFFRDRGTLGLTLAITLGFPLLVVLFALGGLPQIEALSLSGQGGGLLSDLQAQLRIRLDHMRTAQLVTGLIMFEVILLTLIGANNGSREIAAERACYEKERLNGLSPWAYLLSKAAFTAAVATVQGTIMAVIVKSVCGFPGAWAPQLVLMSMTCVAMTWVCLGFSALFDQSEKASLLSVYLVGFQLPLSGVVLALPEALTWFCRPFIAAYWGWAGTLSTLTDSDLYDAWQQSQPDWVWLPAAWLCLCVLLVQGFTGLGLAYWGLQRRLWR
jgi:ABC-type multidrug transport system ATPase subunit